MEQIISHCGIICSECPCYIATQTNDDIKRKETAELFSEMLKMDIKPDNINCNGCLNPDNKLFNQGCEIRKCSIKRNLTNCAYCNDFPCDMLIIHTDNIPGSLDRLRAIQKAN